MGLRARPHGSHDGSHGVLGVSPSWFGVLGVSPSCHARAYFFSPDVTNFRVSLVRPHFAVYAIVSRCGRICMDGNSQCAAKTIS